MLEEWSCCFHSVKMWWLHSPWSRFAWYQCLNPSNFKWTIHVDAFVKCCLDTAVCGSIQNALLKKASLSLWVGLGKIQAEKSRGLARRKCAYGEVTPNQTTKDRKHWYKGCVYLITAIPKERFSCSYLRSGRVQKQTDICNRLQQTQGKGVGSYQKPRSVGCHKRTYSLVDPQPFSQQR